MWGGPCHLDTFDPKPEAGKDYCGPLNKPIATNVEGIRICELLPLLAKQADKYSIIRSMTHGSTRMKLRPIWSKPVGSPAADGLSQRRGCGLAFQRLRCRVHRA